MANKSEAIEQEMRRKIHSKEWRAATRIPSEQELCEEFKVSRTTIRAALNNLRSERLLISRPKVGTLVSSIAGHRSIVLLGRQEDIMAPFGYWYRDLVSCLSAALRELGYNPMLVMGFGETSPEMVETVETHYQSVVRSAAGIVVFSAVTSEIEEYLNSPGMPPWSGISFGTRPRASTVFADYNMLHRKAAELFRERGIEEFATMYISLEGHAEEDQCSWRDALVGRTLSGGQRRSPEDYLLKVHYDDRFAQVRPAFLDWWQRPERPRAIFFSDDALFDAVSHLLVELNIKIPEELAVLSFANVGRKFFFPAVPDRIGQSPEQVTGKLLDLLTMRMENPERRDITCITEWVFQQGDTLPLPPGMRRRSAAVKNDSESIRTT